MVGSRTALRRQSEPTSFRVCHHEVHGKTLARRTGGSTSQMMANNEKATVQKNLTRQQARYHARKQAGKCCYGLCAQNAETGHTFCSQHLQRMSRQVSEIYRKRTALAL